MSVSRRNWSTLFAVSRLPIREDGWRRATYRDQLHEIAGVSRGACQRAIEDLLANGALERQGVGRSARVPEGFRVTARGEEDLAQRPPEPAVGQLVGQIVGQPEPVLGSGLISGSPKEEENSEPTTTQDHGVPDGAVGQIVGQPREPAPLAQTLRLDFPPHVLAVLYAAVAGTPLCACDLPRPMVQREQSKTGMPFWSCVRGKRGCGVTLPVRGQGRRQESTPRRGPRDVTNLDIGEVRKCLQAVADAKRAPNERTTTNTRSQPPTGGGAPADHGHHEPKVTP